MLQLCKPQYLCTAVPWAKWAIMNYVLNIKIESKHLCTVLYFKTDFELVL